MVCVVGCVSWLVTSIVDHMRYGVPAEISEGVHSILYAYGYGLFTVPILPIIWP